MNWKIGYEKYRTNYISVNIRSFVTLSLYYPVFVLFLLRLYAYSVLYYPIFCSPVTLSFHYPVSIKKDKNLLKGSIKQTIICIFAR